MIAQHPFGSPAFNQVARGMIELHRLMKDGKDDSPEADAVRDAMDGPYAALNEKERERIGWLSEDLYSISEPLAEVATKAMNPQSLRYLVEAFEARNERKWDRALELMRRWRSYIEPSMLSYLRGAIWQEVGSLDVAAEFLGHAVSCDPGNASYQRIYLHLLAEVNPGQANQLAAKALTNADQHDPQVVVQAADIRFQSTRTKSAHESAPMYSGLIPILENNLTRLGVDDTDADNRVSTYSMTFALLGFCNEFLGNDMRALECFSNALLWDPENDAMFVSRGMHLYGNSPNAISDFENAVKLRSPLIWPYLFLAHHYLTGGRFKECRKMCEAGLTLEGPAAAKSQLEEWRAISIAELGFPPEAVRESFDAAIELDPSNENAKRNRAAFEQAFQSAQATHAQWEQKPVEEIRQFGLNERRYFLAA